MLPLQWSPHQLMGVCVYVLILFRFLIFWDRAAEARVVVVNRLQLMDPVSVHRNYKTTWDLLMWSNFYLGVQSLKPVLSCSWFWKEPSVSVLFALIQPLLWFWVCFLWFHRTFSALFQNPKYINHKLFQFICGWFSISLDAGSEEFKGVACSGLGYNRFWSCQLDS